jgi:hypothetical protein
MCIWSLSVIPAVLKPESRVLNEFWMPAYRRQARLKTPALLTAGADFGHDINKREVKK